MTIIDETHRFVFIAVPKNASSAIHDAIERTMRTRIPHGPEREFHAPAQTVAARMGERWTRCVTAGFVREPFDRFASAYWDFHRGRGRRRAIRTGFDEFCRAFVGSPWERLPHFRPQVEFLTDANGEPMVSFLGRYERLEADWAALDERLPLTLAPLRRVRFQTRLPYADEWRNANAARRLERTLRLIRWRLLPPARPPLADFYAAAESRDFVREYYARDFECFGYPPAP